MMKNRWIMYAVIVIVCGINTVQAKLNIQKMIESIDFKQNGYTYNFQVWNDSHVTIYVELEDIISFMGGFFQSKKGFYGKKSVPSIIDAAGSVVPAIYDKRQYFFNMYISADATPHKNPINTEYFIQLPLEKNDTKVYYYHAYTQRNFSRGNFVYNPAVELIGYNDPITKDSKKKGSVVISSQLSTLNFFNSSGYDTQISLTYNTAPYTFTVEKYSHASLTLPTPQQKKPQNNALSSQLQSATTSQSVTDSKSASPSNQQGQVTIQAIMSQALQKQPNEQQAQPESVQSQIADFGESQDSSASNDAAANTKPPFSLRPNTITFSSYNPSSGQYEKFQTLELPSQGFDGFAYTLEIFQTADKKMQVGFQGLTPGHYDLSTTPRARDVTPCPCFFWYQSVAQVPNAVQNGYMDLPGQLWIVYPGQDNPIQAKVTVGQAVTWNLTRPSINQGDQFVYFVYVATTDDKVAAQFVQKISQQMLGQKVIGQYIQAAKNVFDASKVTDQSLDVSTDGKQKVENISLTADQQVATLLGNLVDTQQVIEDTDLQVVGYILGTDIFVPKGVGFGRFYYMLAPSLLSTSSLASLFSSYLTTANNDTQALQKRIVGWVTDYIKNPAEVQSKIEQYLIQNGNDRVVDTATKKLTKFGQSCLKNCITGDVSIKYPSLKLSTVTNSYVYDFGAYEQDGWPANMVSLSSGASSSSISGSKQSVKKTVTKPAKIAAKSGIKKVG